MSGIALAVTMTAIGPERGRDLIPEQQAVRYSPFGSTQLEEGVADGKRHDSIPTRSRDHDSAG